MFFHLILENANGDRVDMTATANQYMTSRVEGLNPPTGTISTSSYAGMDGSYLNNAFIEKRNVVIHFEMRGVGIEARRHQLYKVVKPSRYIKIYYKTAGIDVFTEGYVETCEVSNFEMFTTGQISILCPDIYWYANETQTAEYSQVLGAFHFICPDNDNPFPIGRYNTENMMTIVNDGDDTGMTLVISGGPARNPTIYNADTDEYMQIQGDIEEGDVITIANINDSYTYTHVDVRSGSKWYGNEVHGNGTATTDLEAKGTPDPGDRTMKVYWKCGLMTTVPSDVFYDSDLPGRVAKRYHSQQMRKADKKAQVKGKAGQKNEDYKNTKNKRSA